MSILPIGRRVVVRELASETQAGSLILPASDTLMRWCEVVRIGPQCRDSSPGDHVLVSIAQALSVGEERLVPEASIVLRQV